MADLYEFTFGRDLGDENDYLPQPVGPSVLPSRLNMPPCAHHCRVMTGKGVCLCLPTEPDPEAGWRLACMGIDVRGLHEQ